MNPAINAALIAAAAQGQSAQQALVKQLTEAKAFGPSSAVPLTPTNAAEEKALTELVGLMTVRPYSGRYYLDRDRQKEREAQQGWIALVILLAIASLLASALALINL
jgi:hypothetical protein